jgi:chitinase
VQRIPPCTIILPPYPLGHTTTITFPLMVTSVWTVLGGTTRTKTTVVPVLPLVTDYVPFWPLPVVSGYTSSKTTIYPL